MQESKKNFNLGLLSPVYWPAWLIIGMLWLVTQFSYPWQIFFGKLIGKIFYFFPSKLKYISKVNIKLCFPELSKDAQKKMIKKNFISLGIGLIETAVACWTPDEKLQHLFTLHGLEHLEKAFSKGKGIILLGPHFTCLEIVGRLMSQHYAFAVMYRPHKKPLIAFIQEKFRRKKNYFQYIRRNNVRELIRTLNKNVAVWYAYDIDAGKKRSVFAPFFGVQAASLTSVSRLVDLSGASVVPISFYRKENQFKYEITLHPALENFPSGNVMLDSTRLNASLEYLIRQKPEQYMWQYKRFKTRPLHEARLY